MVVRATFQVVATRGRLQSSGGDENEYIYIDLSPLLSVVEIVADYAAIRSDLIHRGVVVFKGILKRINVKPLLAVQITSYFNERKGPLTAHVSATVDYLFQSISSALPVSTHDTEFEDEIPFHLRKGYLKFLLNSAAQSAVKEVSTEEERENFIFC